MPEGKRLTLLHLSDLQFGRAHGFPAGGSPGSLVDRLAQNLARLRDEEHVRPDLVLLSGDLAEWGLPREFEEVALFVRELARSLALDVRRFVLIPGNHDISRKLSRAYFDECEVYGRDPEKPYWPKYKPYADFFTQLYAGHAGIGFTEREPWSLFEYPDLGVVVAGLNSTIADSHRDEDHRGEIGEAQIRAFVEELRPLGEKGYLRIGLVHHDPTRSGGHDGIVDAEAIEKKLAPHLDLLLHGHTHDDKQRWFGHLGATPVPVIGIGSAGVDRAERPAEVGNQFQILQLSRDSIEVGLRRHDPGQGDWIGDTRGDPAGQAWRIIYPVPHLARATAAFAEAPASEPARDAMADAVEQYRRRITATYRGRHFAEQSGLLRRASVDLLSLFVVPQVAALTQRPKAPEAKATYEEKEQEAPWEEGYPEDADAVLFDPRKPWMLVLGGPGSGKSALTSWLMLKLCEAGETLPEGMARFVPVRIEMRRFAQHMRVHKGRAYDFFDYLEAENAELSIDALRSDRLRELAEARRLLWIFDGLDEVVDAEERKRCAAMIGGVRQRYDGRGLITSREVGAEDVRTELSRCEVPSYRLRAFDAAHVKKLLAALPMPEARRERLLHAIRQSPALAEMCRTPLVLTMTALLSLRGEVPERRRDLLGRLVELLVEEWEAGKGDEPESSDLARFDFALTTRFLSKLALWMMLDIEGGSGNVLAEEDLRRFTVAFCREELGEREIVAKRTARRFLEKLQHRNGVLVSWGAGAYGFVHRGFLDYLAAEELHEGFATEEGRELVAELVQTCWRSDAWRECLAMVLGAIGEEEPHEVIPMLQAVLRRLELQETTYANFIAFAVRVLAEVYRGLDQEPLRSFASRLTELLRRCCEARVNYPLGGTAAITEALRQVGEQWPAASILREWALGEFGFDFLGHRSGSSYRMALATTPLKERRELLDRIVERSESPEAIQAATEEVLSGQDLAPDDAARLYRAAERKSERVALAVGEVLLQDGVPEAARWIEDSWRSFHDDTAQIDGAILLASVPERRSTMLRWLIERAESSDKVPPTIRAFIARTEVDDPFLYETLTSWFRSSHSRLRLTAAMALAHGHDDPEAFDQLERFVRGRDENFADLALYALLDASKRDGAAASEIARSTLRRLLQDPTDVGPSDFEHMAWWWEQHVDAAEAAAARAAYPGTYEETPPSDHWARFNAATDALEGAAEDPERRRAAQSQLRELVTPAAPEEVRLPAAIQLRRIGDPLGEATLRELAHSAANEDRRCFAARQIRDLETLHHLATSAQSDQVRADAAHVLALLDARRALLRVGRPRRGIVSLRGQRAGIIEETPTGSRFTYDPDYLDRPDAKAIAPSLPLRRLPYESEGLHPFFENLLPEGWLLHLARKTLGTSGQDLFGLLLATCRDCIGAVEIVPEPDDEELT
ncbi:HipA N-terminal domain-containing protein [Polyangium spumosum]|uniref:NACHT domain-containing protein n=1 Tax=Polyangium spumosum TaxID=889282 RepID=A0A6N7PUP0_9BACT|nr:HipA N-terminal domain-containing protein [Polyangium spumosum]MRG95952.1 NACHT domain-containing protein [Polyangium spumosum]